MAHTHTDTMAQRHPASLQLWYKPGDDVLWKRGQGCIHVECEL